MWLTALALLVILALVGILIGHDFLHFSALVHPFMLLWCGQSVEKIGCTDSIFQIGCLYLLCPKFFSLYSREAEKFQKRLRIV